MSGNETQISQVERAQTKLLRGGSGRFAISAVPAALATIGLFLFMNNAIAADDFHASDKEQRMLEAIIPQLADALEEPDRRPLPKRPADIVKPPPPPKISMSKNSVGLPMPIIQGGVPSEVGFDKIEPIKFDIVSISDRDAQPIREPLKVYPDQALQRGIEGSCDVYLDVDVQGRPYNVRATCTDSIFARAAQRSVRKAEFAPKIVRGQPVERRNVVYPIEYTISDEM